MAHQLKTDVSEVIQGGFGLAFIAYPNAILSLSWSNVWAALFFVMLFTLGLDSQFTTLETLSTGLEDLYPRLRQKKTLVLFTQCVVMFTLGLTTCTKAGQEWINLFDSYTGSWGLLFSTLLEIIVVGSIYGGGLYAWITGKEERLISDIEMMIGKKSKLFWLFWRLCWYIVTPLILIVLTFWSLASFAPLEGHPAWVSLVLMILGVVVGN